MGITACQVNPFEKENLSRPIDEVDMDIDDEAGKPSPKPKPMMKPATNRPKFAFGKFDQRKGRW